MKSTIEWQTGMPKEKCIVLIVNHADQTVRATSFNPDDPLDIDYFSICVSYWCNISDIKLTRKEQQL